MVLHETANTDSDSDKFLIVMVLLMFVMTTMISIVMASSAACTSCHYSPLHRHHHCRRHRTVHQPLRWHPQHHGHRGFSLALILHFNLPTSSPPPAPPLPPPPTPPPPPSPPSPSPYHHPQNAGWVDEENHASGVRRLFGVPFQSFRDHTTHRCFSNASPLAVSKP